MNSSEILPRFEAGQTRRPGASNAGVEMARPATGRFPASPRKLLNSMDERPVALQNREALSKLSSENDLLRKRLNQMANFVREAMPLNWAYQAPSFERSVESALQWESRAKSLLDEIEPLID